MNKRLTFGILSSVFASVGLIAGCNLTKSSAVGEQDSQSHGARGVVASHANGALDARAQQYIYSQNALESQERRLAMDQFARSLDLVLSSDLNRPDSLKEAALSFSAANACLYAVFEAADAGYQQSRLISVIVSSPARVKAFAAFNVAMREVSFDLPKTRAGACLTMPAGA